MWKRLSALLVVLLFTACTSQSVKEMGSPYPGADEVARAENRILITFVDRSTNRVTLGGPADYRQRGDYPSSTWSHRIAASLAEEYKLQQIAQWPIATLGVHCVVYEVPLNQSVEQVLKTLSGDKRVDSVQRMHRFWVLSDPYSHLQAALRTGKIETAHRWATGRNVTIGIIDTGVDFTHPALTGQVSKWQDFVRNDDPDSFVKDIHGTAVAGVIAALTDNRKGIVGVAPGSRLIALKACWPEKLDSAEAVCDSLTLAKALDAAVRLKPAILNLSLTGPYDALLAKLIDKAIAERMIVVAADPEKTDANSGFPASMEHVIAVRRAPPLPSATEPVGGDHLIVTPGSQVLTTFPHGRYDFISGSSFAAAHISGVVALLLELQPGLSARQVIETLQTGSTPPSPLMKGQLSRVVDACAATAKPRGPST